MKLLMLTSSLGCGGAETHICALARALTLHGHRVTVASSGGVSVASLQEMGIEHRRLPLAKKDLLSLVAARRGLSRLLRRGQFDLIHVHARIPALLVSPLAKRYGIPLVSTVHARFRITPLLRRLSRWGTCSIAVSEDLKHDLCTGYRLSPDNVRVIPNGVDTARFCPEVGREVSDEPPFLLFVSRLDRDCARAAFLLCRMAGRLRRAMPSLEIRIAGGGDAYRELLRLSERVNEELGAPVIRLLGYIEEPVSLYRRALGVVGVSRVALEAMACGTPVILAGNEGMLGLADSSTLRRGAATNFCCRDGAPLSEERLTAEVLRLLSMKEQERAALGGLLSRYVTERHSMDRVLRDTECFYRDALAHQPSRERSDLVLCGYYGYHNTGDDALLRCAVRRAEALYPDCALSALTKRGKHDEGHFRIRCVSRKNPFAVMRELRGARMLVFGGGTLLQEQTSLRSLLYYAAVLYYAHRRGLRVELWGNGLSPPRTALGERIILGCLCRCERIGLRDSPSLAWALSHLPSEVGVRCLLEQDLALGLPPSTDARADFLCRTLRLSPSEHGDTSCGFAVVTVRGGIGQGFLKILTSWLLVLRGKRLRLLFVPMHPRKDGRLCRRLASLLGGSVAEHLSPSDLVGIMARARIVCGMRLHSLIFAASANVPFVGFGCDPKIEAFCREHGGVFFTDLY